VKSGIPVVFVALLCGCTAQQVDTATNTVSSAVASEAPTLANDALIVAQIEGTFLTVDAGSALHTAVASHGGVVTLSGRVTSAAVREKFLSHAKSTTGVKAVESTLTVDPHLPTSRAQAADFAQVVAVEANLAGQAGLNALPIHVDAHAGVVTLSGTVKTAALRSTLLDAARKTLGVRAVKDHLALRT
jgi:hyperosmotically inducible protein